MRRREREERNTSDKDSNPVRVVNNLQGEGKGDSLERVCEWERERRENFVVGIVI